MKEKILVIDDDAAQRKLYRIQIEKYLGGAFDVAEASSASEGFDKIGSERPACVVLDYRMRGGDGLQLLRRLGEEMPGHPPVIFVSGGMSEALGLEAIALGAEACVEKTGVVSRALTKAIARAVAP